MTHHREMSQLTESLEMGSEHPCIRYQQACLAVLLQKGGTDEEQEMAGDIVEELQLAEYIQGIPPFWIVENLARMNTNHG